ncbi:MAG TPA: class I SAM-dependent methyltransferase [Candidatus Onthousia faecipullorum]|uniref:Class I SAM-dependent methyltransferase n=1 Tax=Candidatus Onthousia faecipullorum TaxID=2840887 RepID=A0A9D1KD52_9FIRM|nr:class I SAM-dependent methyltransferase [Candidatus Onthousia faecipullorum]
MLTPNNFKDYELLDASNGEKLERWGKYILLRPDPTVIWDNGNLLEKYKEKIDAIYYRSNKGGGHWENLRKIPSTWTIKYQDLTFNIKQMGFKHTGIFPEQAVNWEYMMNKIEDAKRHIKVLNLFGYTGAASVACLKAGASVTHVDASKGMVEVCKENVISSGLKDKQVRYLVDDVVKFVKREIRRGNKYDAIVMDPPSYGRGANGEVWDIEKDLANLVNLCLEILSDKPLFFIINSYTTGLSKTSLENLLLTTINKKHKGIVTSSEIGLKITDNSLILPCGIYGRWESYD